MNTEPNELTGLEQQAAEQAHEWLLLLDSAEVREQDRQRFELWLSLDPRHVNAYEEAQAIWQGASTLQALAELEPLRKPAAPGLAQGIKQAFRNWFGAVSGWPALAGGLATLLAEPTPQSLARNSLSNM